MDKLLIPVSSIQMGGLRLNVSVPEAQLRPEGAEPVDAGAIRIQGRIEDVDGDYLFRGTVSGVFSRPCDRCLEQAEAPFEVEATWLFVEGPPRSPLDELADEDEVDEEDETSALRAGSYEGTELDLAPLAWEEIVLALPSKCVCRASCAGLCPHCGANLNLGPCTCRKDADAGEFENKGLAGLKELFPGLDSPADEE